MKKKQPKKQPKKILLSKEDLAELLMVLKDFVEEELLVPFSRSLDDRLRILCERVTTLEIVENNHRAEIRKLKKHCVHDDFLDRISYHESSGGFVATIYKCRLCGRENQKVWWFLSRREKKALKKLGVKI